MVNFNEYPYRNLTDLNLDYLEKKMNVLKEIMDTFVTLNTVTFADPIIWNITTQYARNTVVLDTAGNAYLSKEAVPAGVQLNNSDYWLEIFNFTEYTRTANQNLTVNVETNTTRATHAYNVDDWLIWNDVLYKVTSAIAVDDALMIGTNIVHFTVEDFIKAFMTWATNTIQQYKNDIDASELAYRAQLAQDIASTTANLQSQFNAAIAGATVDSEVINARVGTNSRIYSTLEERLNSQFNTVLNTLSFLNCGNILDVPAKTMGNGLIAYSDNHIVVNGVKSGAETWYNMFSDASAFLIDVQPGDLFTVRQFQDTPGTIIGQIYYNINGNWVIATEGVLRDIAISYTVPSNATGMLLRITLPNDTYSNYNSYIFITKGDTKTNSELEDLIVNNNYNVAVLDSGTDLNNISDSGVYLLAYNRVFYNSPVEAGTLYHNDFPAKTQILYEFTGSAIYVRSFSGGQWIGWRKIQLYSPTLIKKLAMFGDSITWGRDGSLLTPTQVDGTIPKIVDLYNTEIEATNYGVGGMGWISRAYNNDIAYDKISSTDLTGYDYVSMMFGVNDYYQTIGTYLDDENDNTIMGEIYHCMNYIRTNYPKITCILISMPNATNFKDTSYGGFPEYDYNVYNLYADSKRPKDLHDEMVKFAERYHIPFIDLNNNGITSFNITSLLPDNVHPNQDGYFKLGGYIAGELKKIIG